MIKSRCMDKFGIGPSGMVIVGESPPLAESDRRSRFEAVFLPHLDAAYNLARWLTHDDHDAEDVVQEAFLRAFRYFDGFHGEDGRTWFLAIVRNTCMTWLKRQRSERAVLPFDETLHSPQAHGPEPDSRLLQAASREAIHDALGELSAEFREVIVLRELEGLSYKDIARIIGSPIGTVMSRLARGRDLLRQHLAPHQREDS